MENALYALIAVILFLFALATGFVAGWTMKALTYAANAQTNETPVAQETAPPPPEPAPEERNEQEAMERIRKAREAAKEAWEAIQNYSLDDAYGVNENP